MARRGWYPPGPGPQGAHLMATTDSSAPAHPSTEEKRLAKLEDRYRHELMADDERMELHDRIARIRRRLRSGLSR
jgi:hypothetical protein